ncbi:MAG: hypothetical protein V8R40_14280 [Dysosmobacter sp.]
MKEYASQWLDRQSRYAPSTLTAYRRMLEVVSPYIGAIPLCHLRAIHMENLLAELRKRTCHGKPVQETTIQKYLTVMCTVLSNTKRNEMPGKNSCPHGGTAPDSAVHQARPVPGRGAKASGRTGAGAPALPAVLPALPVHRLPAG